MLVAAPLLFPLCRVLYPLLQVLSVALLDGGWPSLRPLAAFFGRPLFREALVNTLYMQSALGRGPGAPPGVVAIALVAVGIWAAPHLASRSGSALFRA